jgi:hypothetical protein
MSTSTNERASLAENILGILEEEGAKILAHQPDLKMEGQQWLLALSPDHPAVVLAATMCRIAIVAALRQATNGEH